MTDRTLNKEMSSMSVGDEPSDPVDYLRYASTDNYPSGLDLRNIRRLDSHDEGNVRIPRGSGRNHHQTTKLIDSNKSIDTEMEVDAKTDPVDLCGLAVVLGLNSEKISEEERRAYRIQADGPVATDIYDPPPRERPAHGEKWPYRETLSFTRSLTFYGAGSITRESEIACACIQEARHLRYNYYGGKMIVMPSDSDILLGDISNDCKNLNYKIGSDGVYELFHSSRPTENLVRLPNIDQFRKDYHRLVEICSEGAMRSFCFQRLQMLGINFKQYITLNATIENQEQISLLGNDFYRTMKIDNHIHAAAAPSAKQFVQFVGKKLEDEGETVVHESGITLSQAFQEAGLDKDHLTIDAFNVLADYSVYQRFDNFNSKYSPFKLADMRRIFLKTTNNMGGRYFAELLKNVLDRHEKSKGHNSACEMRLSIYGMERHEWFDLAKWVLNDWQHPDYPGPVLSKSNRWLIQVPRLWRIYCTKPSTGDCKRSFLEMIDNLFVPMFEATLFPDQHPEVAEVLKHIVGLDSVDDEGALEDGSCVGKRPHEWTKPENPSYWWQLYFIWANLEVLNQLRKARGLNTLAFRPHAGETGDAMHLATTYLLCQSINHGIALDAQVSLQYLYYLDQIGLSISPLSNNFLFRKIAENPFPKFFRRGLNVTLSTDDPLLFHLSDDPLLEEYSVARATFGLSMTDMMEIARNSVLQSGFDEEFKRKWLGKNYRKGLTFCDEGVTHVPLVRAKFRAEHLAIEHMFVHLIAAGKGNRVLREMKTQFGLARDAHRDVLFENFEEVPSFPERGQL